MEQQHIFIKLLGTPEIRLDGQPVKLPFRQAEAMVYYLAVNGSVSKDRLCDLLWGTGIPRTRPNPACATPSAWCGTGWDGTC